MSGFDFGSLRDPDAPQPDSHHRDAVEARAHELRARTRRNWTILSALAVIVVIALVAGIVATRPDKDEVIVRNPSSTTTTTVAPTTLSSIDHRFIPPTTMENGLVVLPVTQPDGETYTLRYPPAMRIAQLGFRGGIGVSGTEVQIDYATIRDLYFDSKPLAEYRAANGATVPVFPGYRPVGINGPPPDNELAFQFGPWLARVSVAGKTDAQRAIWARNLTGTLDANGFLVLHASAPLSVNNEFEGGFGNAEKGDFLDLASHLYCAQPESYSSVPTRFTNGDGTKGVAWCDGDLLVHAKGSSSFVDLAATELKVSPLTSPSSPPTTTSTTTTTTPAPTNAPAVSASFVSTTHGWVLQRNGDVAETTDGGMSWKALGSVGPIGDNYTNPQIRFADAKRGFVHTDRNLLTTDDGGAHWQQLATPFGGVTDLAISRGVVYLVAQDASTNGIRFTLWSSPTDRLAWTKDPLTLPVGAGPVPVQQLVFSGGQGWVTNGDRGISGGARLSAIGHWQTWKPPCLGAYAWVAASSATDMVASCEEGVWTGPKITESIYFSHDGGTTFQRHDAPGSGLVTSPNGASAIVATNGKGLQRTTDDGVTWQVVASEAQAALDLGFTTTTQGFVIFSDGTMLMTYDAGATWSAVTLP